MVETGFGHFGHMGCLVIDQTTVIKIVNTNEQTLCLKKVRVALYEMK